jgi:hypothetical protein
MRALELLNYLGALDDDGNLTEVASRAPVRPRAVVKPCLRLRFRWAPR